jgi:hypothetical protein
MKLSQWNEGITITLQNFVQNVTKLLIIYGIIWYAINEISIYIEIIFNYMHNKIYNVNNLSFGISLILIKNKVHKKKLHYT